MLTAAPYLRLRRPSPTTAEFTITTAPPATLPIRLLLLSLIPLRFLAGFSALLLSLAKLQQSPHAITFDPTTPAPPVFSDAYIYHVLHKILLSPAGTLASYIAAALPVFVVAPVALILLWAALKRIHVTESLLVLRGLGVQTSSSSGSYLAKKATRFIPTEKIRDILVNEAFLGFEVRYYLVIIVDGEDDVVVVFPKLLPRRRIVETVWRGVRGCLYEVEDVKTGTVHA
ncbi:GPI-GlcNAc transferase complex [Plectosphaerella plurivora]|uniref:GPI-GlcNAc transferase complex n=1 Tax=Plectosphaerella plurivora TaxID=936078 RepID=A0A9P9AGN8_9PEZI|nr:GPI-GlcNAc transferase complex [Plectosphaerella plurivora]